MQSRPEYPVQTPTDIHVLERLRIEVAGYRVSSLRALGSQARRLASMVMNPGDNEQLEGAGELKAPPTAGPLVDTRYVVDDTPPPPAASVGQELKSFLYEGINRLAYDVSRVTTPIITNPWVRMPLDFMNYHRLISKTTAALAVVGPWVAPQLDTMAEEHPYLLTAATIGAAATVSVALYSSQEARKREQHALEAKLQLAADTVQANVTLLQRELADTRRALEAEQAIHASLQAELHHKNTEINMLYDVLAAAEIAGDEPGTCQFQPGAPLERSATIVKIG